MKELIADLNKAGKLILQYQKFHHDLQDLLYVKLDLTSKMPDSIQTINVDKEQWDRLNKVANLIKSFKANAA